MALLYTGNCKECGKETQLCDADSIGMNGWQDTSRNGICGDCCDKLDKAKSAKIDSMSIEERLTQIEKQLKIRK